MRHLILFVAAVCWGQAPETALLQQSLTKHLAAEGTVRYGALKADLGPLRQYVRQMESVSPDSHAALFPTREAKLAYWLNGYNALVLYAMASDYPEEKKRLENAISRAFFFYRRKFRVGGRERTLSGIEDHDIREQFRDARIHFAIVCASRGCPWLSKEAFRAETVERQLEEAARQFFGQERNCAIDTAQRRIRLSSIFKWFARDFGATDAERLAFVARYRPAEAAALQSGKWKIEYVDWDWKLNDAP
jgi:hypothetical protein